MTLRDQINSRMSKIRWRMFIPLYVSILFVMAAFHFKVGPFSSSGFSCVVILLHFGLAMALQTRFMRCPQCDQPLSCLARSSWGVVRPDAKCCPFCGLDLDAEVREPEKKGEQAPGTYSSKAADGLTGNAQE